MTIEHKLQIELTVTTHDADDNVIDASKQELTDGQITLFRELCDECYADTGCSEGDDCCMYEDRVFRGGDAS